MSRMLTPSHLMVSPSTAIRLAQVISSAPSGRGEVLRAQVQSPTYATVYHDPRGKTDLEFPMPEVAFLKASVVHSPDDGMATLFLLNRSLDQDLSVTVQGSGFSSLSPQSATVLRNDDLEATNTRDEEAVAPRLSVLQ